MNNIERLKRIAEIIEGVDHRCMAADGPVTPTLDEMTQKEISEIYKLASQQEDSLAEPCDCPVQGFTVTHLRDCKHYE